MQNSRRSYIRTVADVAKVCGLGLALVGVTMVVRAAAARTVPPPALALASLTPRVPSPADLALQGSTPTLPPRDRIVAIENVNSREEAVFNIGPGGYVRSDQVPALERFFRCRRTDRRNPIDPAVLELLAQISERWPGRVIEFLSGFRAPPFGVPNSRHFIGHAIDLRVRGVRTSEVRDFLWREHAGIGVGYYAEGDFVHVDSRGDKAEAAWSGHNESATYERNPAWARRLVRSVAAHLGSGAESSGSDHVAAVR